jgi:hypothetical protein
MPAIPHGVLGALLKAARSPALRGLERSKLGDLSKVSRLPFVDEWRSFAPSRMESDIDPRLLIGAGALGMFPAAAGTALGIRAYRPHEEQAMREDAWLDEAEAKQGEIWEMLRRLKAGE